MTQSQLLKPDFSNHKHKLQIRTPPSSPATTISALLQPETDSACSTEQGQHKKAVHRPENAGQQHDMFGSVGPLYGVLRHLKGK